MSTRIRTYVLALSMLAGAASADAAAITLELGDYATGATPSSAAPWLTLTFTDTGANAVQLAIQSSLDVDSEFISDLVFNTSVVAPDSITFTKNAGSSTGTFQDPTISAGANGVTLPPLSGFDLGLSFSVSGRSGGAERFNLNDRLVYDLTCSACDASSFNVANAAGWYAATHFQGLANGQSGKWGDRTGGDNEGLQETSVPEPLSLLLFGVGGVALVARMRRHQRRTKA